MADFQHAGSPKKRKEANSIVVTAVTGGWFLCIDIASSRLNPLRYCVFAEQQPVIFLRGKRAKNDTLIFSKNCYVLLILFMITQATLGKRR